MTGTAQSPASRQNDLMLWIAAGAIGAIGLVWLLMSQLGGGGSPGLSAPASTSIQTAAVTEAPDVASDTQSASEPSPGDSASPILSSGLDDPLRAARMAYDAGMLVEPEDYSAWALYGAALEAAPQSVAARDGLEQVAADLLARGASAAEQGRFDDAEEITDRILARLPEHEAALELKRSIDSGRSRQAQARSAPPVAAPEITAAASATESETTIERPSVAPATDPEQELQETLAKLHEQFKTAVIENRLLAPADDSARGHLQAMLDADADHEQSIEALNWLIDEMMSRSRQSSEATDWEAATTWIDEAEALGADAGLVAEQRGLLTERRIAAESQKRLPASSLTVRSYVPPDYPRFALSRNIEGWVDVEFRVTTAGRTQDVTIVESSHDRMFEHEAIDAVSQWEFEPREFLGQPIEQLAFTRVRFVLSD